MSGPDLQAQKLMFFGRISASLSHELKNVLATINEYSGLLDDLSQVATTGKPLGPERLQSICGKISRQIARGEELIRRLNRFSHRVDEPLATFDLRELLTLICDLCNRFARLKQVTLERRFPQESMSLTLDSFALLYAVTLAIDIALGAASEQGRITVAYELRDGCNIRVEISEAVVGSDLVEQPEHTALEQVCSHLGAGLQLEPGAIVLQLG